MAEQWRVYEQLLAAHVSPQGYRRFATVVFGQAFADGCTWDDNPANERLSIAERAARMSEVPAALWTTLHEEHGVPWERLEKAAGELGVSLPARPAGQDGPRRPERPPTAGPGDGGPDHRGPGDGGTGDGGGGSRSLLVGGGVVVLVLGVAGVAWSWRDGGGGGDTAQPGAEQGTGPGTEVGTDPTRGTGGAEVVTTPPEAPTSRLVAVTVLDWFDTPVAGTVTVPGSPTPVSLSAGTAQLQLPLSDAPFTVESADHHAAWHGVAPEDLASGRLVVPPPCHHEVKLPSSVKEGGGAANSIRRGLGETIGAACPAGSPATFVVDVAEPTKKALGPTVSYKGTARLGVAESVTRGMSNPPTPLERAWSCSTENTALLGGATVGVSSVVECMLGKIGGDALRTGVNERWAVLLESKGACDTAHPCTLRGL